MVWMIHAIIYAKLTFVVFTHKLFYKGREMSGWLMWLPKVSGQFGG